MFENLQGNNHMGFNTSLDNYKKIYSTNMKISPTTLRLNKKTIQGIYTGSRRHCTLNLQGSGGDTRGIGPQCGDMSGSFLRRRQHDWGMGPRVASERAQNYHRNLLAVWDC